MIGFEPGTDRKLPTWKQITDYFTALDKASPRVSVRTLGITTLGRPFLVAFISEPSTLANAPRLHGKAAMVDVKRGRGHVILYGFRPQYRAQSNSTFPLIWAALK